MLKYYPSRGEIVICNYSGFKEPEMTKVRPVIIVSPRFRTRGKLCTVIPLSTTAPNPPEQYHFQINLPKKLPKPFESSAPWVKTDMINTVSMDRLSPIKCGKGPNGERKYCKIKISNEEIQILDEKLKKFLNIK